MSLLQQQADLTFLALTVWREARGESHLCKLGIAFSIINRVTNPSWWGNDLMSVVFKKWQYSSMTAPKDPNLVAWPRVNDLSWDDSLVAASNAITRSEPNPVPGADSYYDISISAPKWATQDKFVRQLGRVRFYNIDEDHESV